MFAVLSVCSVILISSTSFGIEVTPLTLANSVVVTHDKELCFPKTYTYLRARLLYGKLIKDLQARRTQVENAMGKYGSADEPIAYAKKRICDEAHRALDTENNKYCPLGQVKDLSTDSKASNARIALLKETMDMESTLGVIISSFNRLPSKFHSPDKTIKITEAEEKARWEDEKKDSITFWANETENGVFYPQLDTDIEEGLDFLKVAMKGDPPKLHIPVWEAGDNKGTDFVKTVEKLQISAKKANDKLQLIEMAGERLHEGYFPETLFPFNEWFDKWRAKKDDDENREQDRQLVAYLTRLPLTAVKRNHACMGLDLANMAESCVIDIITFIPSVDDMYEVSKMAIQPHPVPLIPDRYDSDWAQVQVKHGTTLYLDNKDPKKPIYYSSYHQMSCFSTIPNEKCQICTSHSGLSPISDPCMLQIITETITSPPCTVETAVYEHTMQIVTRSISTRVDGDLEQVVKEIIMTNNETSTILETCPGKVPDTKTVALPRASRVKIDRGCLFNFVNAPMIKDIMPNLDFRTIKHSPMVKETVKTITQYVERRASDIQEHFKEYGYIYILSISGFVLLLIILFLVYCACRRWCMRRNYRHERKRHIHTPSPPLVIGSAPAAYAVTYPSDASAQVRPPVAYNPIIARMHV